MRMTRSGAVVCETCPDFPKLQPGLPGSPFLLAALQELGQTLHKPTHECRALVIPVSCHWLGA